MMTGMYSTDVIDLENTDLKKTVVIDAELSRWQIEIAALQEARLAGAGSISEMDYNCFWFGKAPEEPCIYGTG